jgi:formylglycine-generating enzyme required for sulfatase activity
MKMPLAVKVPRLFLCLLATAYYLHATESIPDEPDKADKPAADLVIGKEPGQVEDDNGLNMKLVWCPAGKFTMGSPKSETGRQNVEDQVEVTLTKGYWLGKYEVTQSEWKQVMSSEPWKGKDFTKEGSDFPATYVSWDDAMQFCRNLTERERKAGQLPGGWEYSLPTESQWEYACRAGTTTRFSFGDDESKLSEFGWWGGIVGEGNAKSEQYPHSVGRKNPNPRGLYDMHGNVAEWCRDYVAGKLPGGRDPEVTTARASVRIVRGGSWDGDAASCRSAVRGKGSPENRAGARGFRVARTSVQTAK